MLEPAGSAKSPKDSQRHHFSSVAHDNDTCIACSGSRAPGQVLIFITDLRVVNDEATSNCELAKKRRGHIQQDAMAAGNDDVITFLRYSAIWPGVRV